MPYCTNCGEEVTPDQRFCSYCGEALDERETRGSRRQQTSETSDRTPNRGGNWEEEEQPPRHQTPAGRQPVGESPPQGPTIPRKNAVDTIVESAGWLFGVPVLIAAFLVVDLLNSVGELLDPVFAAPVQITGLLAGLLVGGVAYIYVEHEVSEEPVEFGSAVAEVTGQLLSLIGILLIYFVAVGVGLVFFILPGIYLGARLILAFPACVIDKEGAFESVSTSWDVAGGNVLKLVGIFLLSLVPILLVFLVGFSEAGIDILESPLFILAVAPLSAVVTGIIEMATARVYLENRVPAEPAHRELAADQPPK